MQRIDAGKEASDATLDRVHRYHVYIMASRSRRIYTEVTGALEHRVLQHKRGEVAFTAKYRMTRLVLVEPSHSIEAAIAREKQIKGWRRSKKLALIEAANPTWDDLTAEWDREDDSASRRSEQQVPPPSPALRARSGSG